MIRLRLLGNRLNGLKSANADLHVYVVGVDAAFDRRSRLNSEVLGVFPEIWTSTIVYLSRARARVLSALTDDTINGGDSGWCRRWLRICGIVPPQGTRVRDLRERSTTLRDAVVRGEQVPVIGATNPLPWRLSERAKTIVNGRVVGISYPHNTPTCCAGKQSFVYREGCWRTAEKIQAFLVVLVPSLRGFVTSLRTALRSIVFGLRLLEGQTFSVNEQVRLGLDRGFKAIEKAVLGRAKTLILEGLSMLEGCCPVRQLAPALHCLVHYADATAMHGILKMFWMMSFGTYITPAPSRPHDLTPHHHLSERFNKKCKNLTSNKHFPFESLANSLVRDAAARFHRWRRGVEMTRHDKIPRTEVRVLFLNIIC